MDCSLQTVKLCECVKRFFCCAETLESQFLLLRQSSCKSDLNLRRVILVIQLLRELVQNIANCLFPALSLSSEQDVL